MWPKVHGRGKSLAFFFWEGTHTKSVSINAKIKSKCTGK